MDLLILLIKRHHQLVSRTEMVDHLWGKGIFIDVETGLNTAVRKVRQALRDAPESPKFIETVAGKGYRFIGKLDAQSDRPVETRLMLAVLPFANLGADPEREYLADGLTEEAIAAVGQIDPEHMSVIGRTSVMAYKGRRKTLAEIGEEIGAAYLVEGSVRSEMGRLRVTARLVRVQDQVQMWSASYDSEPDSILTLQRELSTAIAEQIRMRLSPTGMEALVRRRTQNPEAYDLYLRGRHYWNQLTPAMTRRAVECYRNAVELDPQYALAWSGLCDAYSSSPITSDAQPLQVLTMAREAATKAVSAEPELAEAQTSLGFMNLFVGWDWNTAEAAFRRAIALDANYPLAHRMLGVLLAHMNRYDEAIPAMRRARELDPLYAMHHALSAQAAFMGRDFREAARFAKQAVVVNSEFWVGHLQLGQALGELGETGLEEFRVAGRLSGGNSKSLAYAGYVLGKSGRVEEAQNVLDRLEADGQQRYVPPSAFALVLAGMGEVQQAFEWLARAYEVRDVHLVFLPTDVRWDELRGDARFDALLKNCGFTAN